MPGSRSARSGREVTSAKWTAPPFSTDIQNHYLRKRLARLHKVWSENRANYAMLRAAGYGSLATYLYYKVAYFFKYRKLTAQQP